MEGERSRLEAVRARIDAVDAELLRLVDERAELARTVGEIKRASGEAAPGLNIRPDREAELLRRLLSSPRRAASRAVIVRIWRELIGESLRIQKPMKLAIWGGRDRARALELARQRFGVAPPVSFVDQPEAAIAAAKAEGMVAIVALDPTSRWWGRLLAEPDLRVFGAMPCLRAWGPLSAFAVGAVPVEPSGLDETYWVTDSPKSAADIEAALSAEGVAATLIQHTGGLKLFALPGYLQPDDARLAKAPGKLSGVIGAAPAPFDL